MFNLELIINIKKSTGAVIYFFALVGVTQQLATDVGRAKCAGNTCARDVASAMTDKPIPKNKPGNTMSYTQVYLLHKNRLQQS